MRPLFTVHAGEYLVGAHLESRFKHLRVWLPSRDTGVDLLVSDRRHRQAVALQVKFSKDFLTTHIGPEFQKQLRACGWWSIDRDKLRTSVADYWVFVLQGFASRTVDFVIVPPRELWRRLRRIHRPEKKIQSYLWVTETKRCWETRGLTRKDQLLIAHGEFRHGDRNLTAFLNNWAPISQVNR